MKPMKSQLLFQAIVFVALLLSLPIPFTAIDVLIGFAALIVLTMLGFWFANKAGIGWFGWQKKAEPWRDVIKALGLGLALGAVLLIILRYGVSTFEPRILQRLERDATIPLWKWLIILFHAPILEETIFRLFTLSFVAWILTKFKMLRSESGSLTPAGSTWANVVAAFLFALVHLPAWYQAGEVSAMLLASIIGLNMIAGYVCGWVYLRKGIEFAILTHLGGDVALHLGGRFLL